MIPVSLCESVFPRRMKACCQIILWHSWLNVPVPGISFLHLQMVCYIKVRRSDLFLNKEIFCRAKMTWMIKEFIFSVIFNRRETRKKKKCLFLLFSLFLWAHISILRNIFLPSLLSFSEVFCFLFFFVFFFPDWPKPHPGSNIKQLKTSTLKKKIATRQKILSLDTYLVLVK